MLEVCCDDGCNDGRAILNIGCINGCDEMMVLCLKYVDFMVVMMGVLHSIHAALMVVMR